jgi:hypothetical protein
MHIITGLALAALMGRKGGRPRANFPRLTVGPIQTPHVLPGRIRFRIPSLEGDEETRRLILRKVPPIDGVESVDVNTVTGSVVIRYDQETIGPALLFAVLARLTGLEKEVEKTPPPLVTRELREMFASLNRAVYQQTGGIVDFWTAMMLGLVGFGMYRFLIEGGRAFPPGFTLLWWAFHGFAYPGSE